MEPGFKTAIDATLEGDLRKVGMSSVGGQGHYRLRARARSRRSIRQGFAPVSELAALSAAGGCELSTPPQIGDCGLCALQIGDPGLPALQSCASDVLVVTSCSIIVAVMTSGLKKLVRILFRKLARATWEMRFTALDGEPDPPGEPCSSSTGLS